MKKKKNTIVTETTEITKEEIEKYEQRDDSAVIEKALKAKDDIETKAAEMSIAYFIEKYFKEIVK